MDETTETTEVSEAPQTEEPKGMRATIEKQAGTIKSLREDNASQRTQIMAGYYDSIGLDPSKELGKAISKEYEGPTDLESLTNYAREEYGYVKKEAVEPVSPQAQQIAQGHAALDQIGQTAGSVPLAPEETDVLAKAEAEGDYATTMAIKSQRMAEMMRTR